MNYIIEFYKDIVVDFKLLWQRLNLPSWTNEHSMVVHSIKQKLRYISCLALPRPNVLKIVEIDASDLGFGGNIKTKH